MRSFEGISVVLRAKYKLITTRSSPLQTHCGLIVVVLLVAAILTFVVVPAHISFVHTIQSITRSHFSASFLILRISAQTPTNLRQNVPGKTAGQHP